MPMQAESQIIVATFKTSVTNLRCRKAAEAAAASDGMRELTGLVLPFSNQAVQWKSTRGYSNFASGKPQQNAVKHKTPGNLERKNKDVAP